eukprot:31260-Pelagococcus_subviridis.AAC.26
MNSALPDANNVPSLSPPPPASSSSTFAPLAALPSTSHARLGPSRTSTLSHTFLPSVLSTPATTRRSESVGSGDAKLTVKFAVMPIPRVGCTNSAYAWPAISSISSDVNPPCVHRGCPAVFAPVRRIRRSSRFGASIRSL